MPASAAPRKPPGQEVYALDVAQEIRAQAKGKLKKFYATRSFQPLWVRNGRIGPAADALLGFVATADLDGLNPSAYAPAEVQSAVTAARGGEAAALARAELALSKAFARYVADQRRPSDTGMNWLDKNLKPRRPKPDAVLRAAALRPSFGAYLSSMGWMNPHYLKQRRLLGRAMAQGGSPEAISRLRLNLERARILPGPWTHHIVVDAASGQLWYYQAGKERGAMKVVVGKPEAPTPMLAGMLHYAILNPYWNVPVDLAQTLVAPKVVAGRSLQSMGYEVLSDWSAEAIALDPATVDWPAVASGAREIRLRQLPGPANSMGRAKFMFPNDSGIYLHDTPERELFAKPQRHFSNGCVRLEDAAELGQWLLGRPIRAASKDPEQAVPLKVPVPVFLTYFTAIEGKKGVAFLEDVYGRDRWGR